MYLNFLKGCAKLHHQESWKNNSPHWKIHLYFEGKEKDLVFVQLLLFLGKFYTHKKKWSESKPSFVHFLNELEQYYSTINKRKAPKTASVMDKYYKTWKFRIHDYLYPYHMFFGLIISYPFSHLDQTHPKFFNLVDSFDKHSDGQCPSFQEKVKTLFLNI